MANTKPTASQKSAFFFRVGVGGEAPLIMKGLSADALNGGRVFLLGKSQEALTVHYFCT